MVERAGTFTSESESISNRSGHNRFALDQESLCRISLRYQAEHHRAFSRWHLERKFRTMAGMFQEYLKTGYRFLDVGCGEGDCLALARAVEPTSELWGVDIDERSLRVARQRLPEAKLHQQDMRHLNLLPQGYFDVVHEFGAAFMFKDWGLLARSYLSLVRDGGFVIWELPEAMSMAHWVYLLTRAQRTSRNDSVAKLLCRSFIPWKYTFQSWPTVQRHLAASGFNLNVIRRQTFLYFHSGRRCGHILNLLCKRYGQELLDRADGWARRWVRRSSGYYLVLQKLRSTLPPESPALHSDSR